jgi:predicted secreted protein
MLHSIIVSSEHILRPITRNYVSIRRGNITMVKMLRTGSRTSTKHGVLMIAFGTALCALGSVMVRPMREQTGYVVAAVLTALCLLTAWFSLGIRPNAPATRRQSRVYLMGGAASIVCSLLFWLVQSASIDLRVVGVLAGLVGLLWASWYMRLAYQFQSSSIKAAVLCGLAATTSSIGIIVATRSGLSKLSSVTTVGCYLIILGAQIYLTAVFLHREHARAVIIDRG